jgi:sporulation protein YlmC with PRC-barrel domain
LLLASDEPIPRASPGTTGSMASKETKMLQTKTRIHGLLAAGILTLTASAQSGNSGQTPPAGSRPGSQAGTAAQNPTTPDVKAGLTLQRGDKLVGMDVTDKEGSKIGRVEDIVIKPGGEIAYVVLSGSTPDTMAKQIVVPWRAFRVEIANAAERRGDPMAGIDRTGATDRLVLTADKERLGAAPSFDRMQWPRAGETTVFTESDQYFGSGATAGAPDNRGSRPVEAGMSTPTLFRLSQLRNQPVTDASGMPSGTITQVVVDPITGRVNYVGYATVSVAGAPARTVALPWESVQAARRDDKAQFQIRVTPDLLQAAPEYVGGEEGWKRMSDPAFVREVYTYYQIRPYWNDTMPDHKRNPDNKPGDTPRKEEPRNEPPK